MDKTPLEDLLEKPLVVINVGLEGFAAELQSQNIESLQIDWVPPAGGDSDLADLLSKLGS